MRKDRGTVEPAEIKAFLGEGTEFKGVLSFQGTVRIDGHVEGEVVGDDLLIVGEPGFLKAEVEVGTVVNSGRIVGNIRAKKRVELLPASVVSGNITTPSLIISEGAVFNGTCLMAEPEVGAGPEPEGGRASG